MLSHTEELAALFHRLRDIEIRNHHARGDIEISLPEGLGLINSQAERGRVAWYSISVAGWWSDPSAAASSPFTAEARVMIYQLLRANVLTKHRATQVGPRPMNAPVVGRLSGGWWQLRTAGKPACGARRGRSAERPPGYFNLWSVTTGLGYSNRGAT